MLTCSRQLPRKLFKFSNGIKNFSVFIDEKDKQFFHTIKDWWDPNGSMKTLHYYNDLRIQYIRQKLAEVGKLNSDDGLCFQGLDFIDIGCGAGILCEVKLWN